jgi:hypothetical protein
LYEFVEGDSVLAATVLTSKQKDYTLFAFTPSFVELELLRL